MSTCNSDNAEHQEPSDQIENKTVTLQLDAVDEIEMKYTEINPIDSEILDNVEAILNSSDEAELCEEYSNTRQEPILLQHGYEYIKKINDTLQGEVFKAKKIKQSSSHQSHSRETKINKQCFVTIKKTNKQLYAKRISYHDEDEDITYCILNDALKEIAILQYLDVDNKNTAYIPKFIHLFQSKMDYYLVMDHIEDSMSFKEFINKTHGCIIEKKMQFQYYEKIMKYLFWQLFATIHWLHVDMKCCHLNLMLECIIINDSNFQRLSNGNVEINPNLSIKLKDFDYAEIFNIAKHKLPQCNKRASMFRGVQYCSPEIIKNVAYDPFKADNWALGMMLIHALIGEPLYDSILNEPIEGSAYSSLIRGKLMLYIYNHGLHKYLNGPVLSLINGLLNLNESERYNSAQILQDPWLQGYYSKYREKMEHWSKVQREKSMK